MKKVERTLLNYAIRTFPDLFISACFCYSLQVVPFVYDPANQTIPLLLEIHVGTKVHVLYSGIVMYNLYLIALKKSSFTLRYVFDF